MSADRDVTAVELIKRVLATTDLYEILQVDRDADHGVIKKSFRSKALLLHPDKCDLDGAKEAFQKLSSAHACLMDSEKRGKYDAAGGDDDGDGDGFDDDFTGEDFADFRDFFFYVVRREEERRRGFGGGGGGGGGSGGGRCNCAACQRERAANLAEERATTSRRVDEDESSFNFFSFGERGKRDTTPDDEAQADARRAARMDEYATQRRQAEERAEERRRIRIEKHNE